VRKATDLSTGSQVSLEKDKLKENEKFKRDSKKKTSYTAGRASMAVTAHLLRRSSKMVSGKFD
jgi:hypothetical protein